MAARPTKVLASAALAVLALTIARYRSGAATGTITPGRIEIDWSNGEVAGAAPRCFRGPLLIGRRALDRLHAPSVDAGGPVYDYGVWMVALRAGEANNPQQVIDIVSQRIDLDDASPVQDPSAVEELAACQSPLPRAVIVVRSHASYDSECRCGPGCQLDGAATVRGPSGHYDRIEGGRWTVVDAPTCVPTPCTLAAGSPFVAGACL